MVPSAKRVGQMEIEDARGMQEAEATGALRRLGVPQPVQRVPASFEDGHGPGSRRVFGDGYCWFAASTRRNGLGGNGRSGHRPLFLMIKRTLRYIVAGIDVPAIRADHPGRGCVRAHRCRLHPAIVFIGDVASGDSRARPDAALQRGWIDE